MPVLVSRSDYKDERRCPVCKKIVKPSCKGHENIPYSIFRMIEIKLLIKKNHLAFENRIVKASEKIVSKKLKAPEPNHSDKYRMNKAVSWLYE